MPAGMWAVRLTVSLSPDAHMDETSLRLHLESLAADTPLEGAALTVQPAPARLFCPACDKLVDRRPGSFNCP